MLRSMFHLRMPANDEIIMSTTDNIFGDKDFSVNAGFGLVYRIDDKDREMLANISPGVLAVCDSLCRIVYRTRINYTPALYPRERAYLHIQFCNAPPQGVMSRVESILEKFEVPAA